ncbi:putative N-alpha-acetyltransferase 40 [Hypsibius exemplaris]|uniref:N-alpha-acetyltransferase 40 n=1 Tax=Hypsibius exemplaris TaxID=2072580 RepID=A0A1W0X3S9_HYPEX|nr:putative N-alpha-acetyltransferase 40 [Hypsibius exemplaris]
MKRARKAMGGRLYTAERRVQEANSQSDPTSCLTAEQRVFTTSKDREITLECFRVGTLREREPHIIEWMFTLVERNMKEHYEACSWGWNGKAKYNEMTEPDAWYLIAKDYANSSLAGFCHFRFVVDYGVEVVYCYELQVEALYRSEQIGRRVMAALEALSLQWKMKKVVLTVLRLNQRAINFYMDCGYTYDETSPAREEPEPHYIFSKPTFG